MTQYFDSIFAAYSTELFFKFAKNFKFYNLKCKIFKINLSIKLNSTSRIKIELELETLVLQ